MTALSLVEILRARGITLRTDGRRIGVRPAGALTDEEREALRAHKAEVISLLAPIPDITLDTKTVTEVFGSAANDPHAVACLRFDVLMAVRDLEAGIRSGVLSARRLVHGRPLADWLSLDDVAWLLRAGSR